MSLVVEMMMKKMMTTIIMTIHNHHNNNHHNRSYIYLRLLLQWDLSLFLPMPLFAWFALYNNTTDATIATAYTDSPTRTRRARTIARQYAYTLTLYMTCAESRPFACEAVIWSFITSRNTKYIHADV